jgi:hypothetical protein
MFPAINAKTDHFTHDSISIYQAVAETKRGRSMEARAPYTNIAFLLPFETQKKWE